MADISKLVNVVEKTKLSLEDLDKLVVETRHAVAEADDILIKAKRNREKAVDNYTRALILRTEYIERSIK